MASKYFSYERLGHWWYIYGKDDQKHDHVPMEKEPCRKEVYRLNGWNYIEPIKQNTNN